MSTISLRLRYFITYAHRIVLFYHINFFTPKWNLTFCKNVFIFKYFCVIINFKFRIFFVFFHKSIFVLEFTSTGFILFVLWYVLLYLLTITLNLWSYLMLHYMSYLILKSYNYKYLIIILFFKVFQQQQIFLHYVLNTFLYQYLETMTSLIFCEIHSL